MNVFAISGIIGSIVSGSLATLIYLTDRKSQAHLLWALFCISLMLWQFSAYMIAVVPTHQEGLYWVRFSMVGITLLPVSFYHFACVFTELRKTKSIIFVYLIGCFFLSLVGSPWLVHDVRYAFNQFWWEIPGWAYYPFFILFFPIPFFTAHFYFLRFIRTTKNKEKRTQAKWICWTTFFAFIFGMLCFLPVFGLDVYPVGNYACTIYPIILTYAILRNQPLRVNVALTRLIIFLLIVASILSLPFYIGLHLKEPLIMILGDDFWWVVPVLLMGILSLLAVPTYIWIEKKFDLGFFGFHKRYHETILKASKEIGKSKSLKALTRDIINSFVEASRSYQAALFLKTTDSEDFKIVGGHKYTKNIIKLSFEKDNPLIKYLKEKNEILFVNDLLEELRSGPSQTVESYELCGVLENIEANIILPIKSKDMLLGFVILWSNRAKEAFNKTEIKTLSILINQTAMALQNAFIAKELTLKQAEVLVQESLASTDSLTGLLVRRTFFKKAEEFLKTAYIYNRSCSIIIMDLDDFKKKNDQYGHLTGDQILCEIAKRLAQTLRPGDLLGRYGGEEFILLLPNTDIHKVMLTAERLRAAIGDTPIITEEGLIEQTLSVGIANYPEDGHDLHTLISQADKALYHAKNNGRNCVFHIDMINDENI